jgi:hypothetical protein
MTANDSFTDGYLREESSLACGEMDAVAHYCSAGRFSAWTTQATVFNTSRQRPTSSGLNEACGNCAYKVLPM